MQTLNCTNQADVTVTPIQGGINNGPWQFDYLSRSYNQKLTFPVIDLPKDSGCWTINFSIGGQNALYFSQTNPILVDGAAPPIADQITLNPVGQLAKRLTIVDQNTNSQSTTYQYTLNFTGMDLPHRTLDPVIKNGGRGTHPPSLGGHIATLEAATFIITLAVFITLLFVAYQLVLIRRELRRP